MLRKTFRVAVIVLIALAVIAPAPALAIERTGVGPDNAMLPDGAWKDLGTNARHWYTFRYDGEGEQVEIILDSSPDDGATFHVLTAEQVRAWQETGEWEACGCGTANEAAKADAFWAGNFAAPGLYYVAVEHTGHHASTVSYALNVKGKGVTLDLPAVQPALPAPAREAREGDHPGVAKAPQGGWDQVEADQRMWYAFRYDGEGEAIEIAMDSKPDDAATFHVLTADQVRTWQTAGEWEACGCGTANDAANADAFWSGSFTSPGLYYIAVENTGHHAGAASYSLKIKGKGVSLDIPAPQLAAPAVAAPAEILVGMSPYDYLAPEPGWVPMHVGEEMWYAVYHTGKDAKIEISLDAVPKHGATFSVWTPKQVELWAEGRDVEPVGHGTGNDDMPGDQFWSGNFVSPDVLFIRVEHSGAVPSFCNLVIGGEGVWY